MLYIQLKDGVPFGYPIVHQNLLQLIPTGIAKPDRLLVPDDILSHGFTVYYDVPRPSPSSPLKVVEEGPVVLGPDKAARPTWSERDMTEEEIQNRNDAQVRLVRRQREAVIQSTDWLLDRHRDELATNATPTLSDTQLAKVYTFRQAIRDMDLSSPFNIVWPDKLTLD